MRLIWTKGQNAGLCRRLPVGSSVQGARLGGFRPSSVELAHADLAVLVLQLEADDPEVVKRCISYIKSLKNCLSLGETS